MKAMNGGVEVRKRLVGEVVAVVAGRVVLHTFPSKMLGVDTAAGAAKVTCRLIRLRHTISVNT